MFCVLLFIRVLPAISIFEMRELVHEESEEAESSARGCTRAGYGAVGMIKQRDIYGLLAEFDGPESLLAAAEKTSDAGYHSTDAFTPFPVHGWPRRWGIPRRWCRAWF
jgi:hypothetical protein